MDEIARFEALYRENYGRVLGYALRRASAHAAHDVVADTFLVAWRRLDHVPETPLPWLLGVARRTLANQRRAAGRREALVAQFATAASAHPAQPSDGVETLGALERLPAADQELLTLVAWEGLSTKEAAAALELSHVACRARIHRAKRRTLLAGWAYGAVYGSSEERTRALDGWLWHYNHRRRHSALGRQPLVSRTNLLGSYN